MHHRAVCRLAFAALVVTSAACRDQASPSDFGGTELTSSQLLAAPTNAVADDPAAVELGQQVFFDRGLSSDGTVACVDCHDPANGFSDRALPGDPEWDRMPKALQADIQRVFTNVGKAVEAYERKLLCTDTKFDRWQRGEVQLSSDELAGGDTFNREHCSRCHSGPSLSDGEFHDIGLPSSDRGRALGAPALLDDPLNGAGDYSDDRDAGAAKLLAISSETASEGSFRTASLRGVGQRTFFGHAAHEQTLRGFILDVYRRGGRGGGRRGATTGVRDAKLDDVNVDGDDVNDLIAFLHTLDCPAPSPELLAH